LKRHSRLHFLVIAVQFSPSGTTRKRIVPGTRAHCSPSWP